MADMGNMNKRLRLQCHPCGWVPPEDAKMEAVQLHFQVDHDTSEVKLALLPACRCGESMTHASSHARGSDVTDFFRCGVCGNTGYTTRKEGNGRG